MAYTLKLTNSDGNWYLVDNFKEDEGETSYGSTYEIKTIYCDKCFDCKLKFIQNDKILYKCFDCDNIKINTINICPKCKINYNGPARVRCDSICNAFCDKCYNEIINNNEQKKYFNKRTLNQLLKMNKLLSNKLCTICNLPNYNHSYMIHSFTNKSTIL